MQKSTGMFDKFGNLLRVGDIAQHTLQSGRVVGVTIDGVFRDKLCVHFFSGGDMVELDVRPEELSL